MLFIMLKVTSYGDVFMAFIILFALSLIFGLLLSGLHLLLPWLFGPMIAAVVLKKYTSLNYKWPKWLSDIGLFILGAQIGVSFTKTILSDIKNDWLNIIILSLMVIGCAVGIAFIFKRIVKCSTETALLASIPGALNQMIVMAEENKSANVLVVTLAQTSRLVFVILFVPLISSFVHQTSYNSKKYINHVQDVFHVLNVWQMFFIVICMMIAIFIFKKLHFPVPDMLGPIFVMLIWNLMTGLNFSVPMPLINIAQLLFGVRIGLEMYDLSNQINKQLFIGIFIQNVLLIALTFVICMFMNMWTHHAFNDLFLSAAPGGMAQIIIVGLETHANVAMISSYHIFRIFFILLVISPLMSWYLVYRAKGTH